MFENQYNELSTRIKEGNKCILLTCLTFHNERQGTITEKAILTEEQVLQKQFPACDETYEEMRCSLEDGKIHISKIEQNKAILIEPFFPKPRLVIFGGGHIAKPLSEFASRIGFSVTVIDDRPIFANDLRFPEADKVICESFEKSFDLIGFRKSDFIVIITRGHRHDGVVLREILRHNFSYVGMIGSKRRVTAMKEELLQEGYSKERLDFVKAPIGIDISAVTPDEIGISIVSQLILYKNKSNVERFGKDYSHPEFDTEVNREFSIPSQMPRALITILSSKGSVPRKAGAKMAAYYDGRTSGSIGGGCSEAGVMTKAKNLMLDKGFLIEHIDMTGDVAESEGMVCGGVMEVLIEAF